MTKEFKDMKGVIAIATTPFNNENLIDFESVDRLSNYYIESKVSGVTILGVMGEAHKLNIEEQKTLIKRYVNNLQNEMTNLEENSIEINNQTFDINNPSENEEKKVDKNEGK